MTLLYLVYFCFLPIYLSAPVFDREAVSINTSTYVCSSLSIWISVQFSVWLKRLGIQATSRWNVWRSGCEAKKTTWSRSTLMKKKLTRKRRKRMKKTKMIKWALVFIFVYLNRLGYILKRVGKMWLKGKGEIRVGRVISIDRLFKIRDNLNFFKFFRVSSSKRIVGHFQTFLTWYS